MTADETRRTFTRSELIGAIRCFDGEVKVALFRAGFEAPSLADVIIGALDHVAGVRRQSDAEARGGRGPSASYEEWAAEGREDGGTA